MLNVELMWESLPDLLGGLVLTLELTVLSLIFGMVLALPLAALRTARSPVLWMPVYGYITFFRGTPLLACKETDIWKPAPFGLDERGSLVSVPLLWQSVLLSALPRAGKTSATSLPSRSRSRFASGGGPWR